MRLRSPLPVLLAFVSTGIAAFAGGCESGGSSSGGATFTPDSGPFDAATPPAHDAGQETDASGQSDGGADAQPDAAASGPTTLWVTNNFGGTAPSVLAFSLAAIDAGGNIAPAVTFEGARTTLVGPQCVAFDATGNMWVVDSPGGSMAGQLVKFDKSTVATGGNIAPALTISGSNTALRNPAGCAFDASGSLWIANIDPANADQSIVVSFSSAQLATGGNVAPAVTIGNGANLCNTVDVAFDGSGNLWSASLCTYISGYKKSDLAAGGALTPAQKISQATGVDGITFDTAGNLWTTLQGGVHAVTKFKAADLPTANNNVTATTTISGATTTIDKPVGIAFANGSIWIAEQGANKLMRFGPAALASGGDVAPSATVSGMSTKLSSPTFVLAR